MLNQTCWHVCYDRMHVCFHDSWIQFGKMVVTSDNSPSFGNTALDMFACMSSHNKPKYCIFRDVYDQGNVISIHSQTFSNKSINPKMSMEHFQLWKFIQLCSLNSISFSKGREETEVCASDTSAHLGPLLPIKPHEPPPPSLHFLLVSPALPASVPCTSCILPALHAHASAHSALTLLYAL